MAGLILTPTERLAFSEKSDAQLTEELAALRTTLKRESEREEVLASELLYRSSADHVNALSCFRCPTCGNDHVAEIHYVTLVGDYDKYSLRGHEAEGDVRSPLIAEYEESYPVKDVWAVVDGVTRTVTPIPAAHCTQCDCVWPWPTDIKIQRV